VKQLSVRRSKSESFSVEVLSDATRSLYELIKKNHHVGALLSSFVIFFENLNSEVAIQVDRGSFALRPPEHEGTEVNAFVNTKNLS
jgi:hypothetical protein